MNKKSYNQHSEHRVCCSGCGWRDRGDGTDLVAGQWCWTCWVMGPQNDDQCEYHDANGRCERDKHKHTASGRYLSAYCFHHHRNYGAPRLSCAAVSESHTTGATHAY